MRTALVILLVATPALAQPVAPYRQAIECSHHALSVRALSTSENAEDVVEWAISVCVKEWAAAAAFRPAPAFDPIGDNPITTFRRLGKIQVEALRRTGRERGREQPKEQTPGNPA